MATQLKPDAFAYTTALTRRPSIRVAFSAGAATLAVRDKAATTPTASKTLEEVAGDHVPFRVLLAERNAVVEFLNSDNAPTGDETVSALCTEIARTENLVLKGVAHTLDDAVMRLLALAQVAAEGHEVDDLEAARGIADAQHHFGIGYMHHNLLDQLPTTQRMPADRSAWRAAYDLYCTRRAERRLQEAVELQPAAARYNAVQAQWPNGREISTDPAALAAVEATGIDAAQDAFDELVMIEHDALMTMLQTPAPSASDLATKLDVFVAEEGWSFERSAEPIRVMRDDARRIAGHGAVDQDAALLDAFKTRRAEAAYWLQPDALEGEEIEVRSNAIVHDAEKVLFGTSASTIEGLVAKLRPLFPHIAQYAYAESAAVDPFNPEFRAGLTKDGPNEQVLWGCIEDLARIGGVNLAEQGA